eukprot:9170979-Pyramimonas_sp.AAC.1
MRLARSPRITAEYCIRRAIEYLVPRRLHTTDLPDVSCSALFDWSMAKYTEQESCAVLEIPFRLPNWVNDLMAAEQRESYSHATDVRKLYAILNAGVFLPSKLKWGMMAKTDKKTKNKAPAEG